MSLPLTIEATVKTPTVEGQPDCPFPLSFTSQYDHLVKNRYTFTGSGTKAVDFGSLTTLGAKAFAITVDPDTSSAATPVTVAFNGSATGVLEVAPGGFILFGSPKPTAAGITDMTITYAASVKMYVWIFG